LFLNESTFESVEVGETSYSDCSPNYYVFQSSSPYSPIQDQQGSAICVLNNDKISANWSIVLQCEPSCLNRRCDNDQECLIPPGETISRCICAGYSGKYCENIDVKSFFFFFFFSQKIILFWILFFSFFS